MIIPQFDQNVCYQNKRDSVQKNEAFYPDITSHDKVTKKQMISQLLAGKRAYRPKNPLMNGCWRTSYPHLNSKESTGTKKHL